LRLEATLPRRNPARLSQTYLALGKAQGALSQLDRAVQTLRQAVQLVAQPEAERALAQVQADIARYEQALAAASQSRALLERVRLPDLHSLAFVIALQAQHSLALGRLEMAQQYADELIALLRQRRHELSLAADDPTAQALLSLWRGAEAADAQLAAAEYRAALAVLQAQAQPNAALIKVVTYLLERVTA
jgi:tetratricopeptide (TPR) repeat protein